MHQATVTLSPEELLAISPDIRTKARVSITLRKTDAVPKATMEQSIVPPMQQLRREHENGHGGIIDLEALPYDAYLNELA